jgi:deoxyribonucleoside regulator
MMEEKDRLGLLYKVASLYYEQGWKKFRIAREIDQSPTQVANLLREAQEARIVSIEINLPRLQVLQNQLKKRFALRDAVVIPYDKDCAVLLKLLGKAAAEYFTNNVTDGMKVGLGGGYLVHETVAALPESKRNIHIYPTAIIGRGPTIAHIDPIILVTLLWAKSGRKPERAHYLTVTPPDKATTRQHVQRHYAELQKNRKVRELFDAMKEVDIVLASVGALDVDSDYLTATQYITKNLLSEMKITESEIREEGAVGDIAYSFFDENGNTKPEWNVFTSLGVKHLKQMAADSNKQVVVVAGSYKMKALKAILRGRICNVLITDADAAARLLKTGQ